MKHRVFFGLAIFSFVLFASLFFTTCEQIGLNTEYLLGTPRNVAVNAGSSQLTVSWSEVADADYYEVWYTDVDNDVDVAEKVGTNSSNGRQLITDLTNGSEYYVWVRAVNSERTGSFSNSVAGIPSDKKNITVAGDSGVVVSSPSTFEVNPGSTWADIKADAVAKITYNTHYEFDSWVYVNASGTAIQDTDVFNENKTVFVKTRKKKITITVAGDSGVVVSSSPTFEADLGSTWADIKVTAEGTVSSIEVGPTSNKMAYYTEFMWRLTNAAGALLTDDHVFDANATVYAFCSQPAFVAIPAATGIENGRNPATITSSTITDPNGVLVHGRKVNLSKYNIAKFEVTYELWKKVYDWAINKGYSFSNPGRQGGDKNNSGYAGAVTEPVTTIYWLDAVVWCNAYTEMVMGATHCVYTKGGSVLKTSEATSTGLVSDSKAVTFDQSKKGFRLPTEAEWEYAARHKAGGSLNSVYNASGSPNSDLETAKDYAWFSENSGLRTHLVGEKKANAFGIYDMSGNVGEFCFDRWSQIQLGSITNPVILSGFDYCTRRGGSHDQKRGGFRVGTRQRWEYTVRLYSAGFRLVWKSE